MSDLAAPDAQAPSSASTESSPVLEIPKDAEAYAKWRQTGEIESKPKEADSAPAKETSADGEEPEEKTAPAPEAGKETQEQRKPRSDAASRLNELLADLKRAGLTPSELKSFKREAQQAQAKPPETTVQPPAPPPQPPKELKAPKLEDFKSWEEFEQAREAYSDQRTQQKMQQMLAEYLVNQQAQQRIHEAKQRYGEEAESSIVSAARALNSDQRIHQDVKYMVQRSLVLPDLLYVMGSNESHFNNWLETARVDPAEAIRRLVTVENLVIEELQRHQKAPSNGQATERDESGKFVKTPAKRVSEAPPPATEVSGKSTPPKDASEAAFERGDIRAWMREENRRDIARRQGQ